MKKITFYRKDVGKKINQVEQTCKVNIITKKSFSEYVQKLLSPKYTPQFLFDKKRSNSREKKKDLNYVNDADIPKSFDARKRWSHCTIIGEILDQGMCGNCWAVTTIAVFSDRLCIATKGQINKHLSIEQLTFCCEGCIESGCILGCSNFTAWQHLIDHGVVTGGNYNTTDGCQPYKVMPCFNDMGKNICAGRQKTNHECIKGCYGNPSIDFEKDHWKAKDAYYLSYENMQKDILLYGPIQVFIYVQEDLSFYGCGIYRKSSDTVYYGPHSVKVIGWGEENNVKYWLCVNSWGKYWGENGLFKIYRDTNECSIETFAYAGRPLVFEKNGIYYPFEPPQKKNIFKRLYDGK
ncbi:Cysteine peptidase, cysteine active site,Peptidase C1A, papain C-terminal,Cysteine peptidase [Cinara cedri]|uniref:Cysteine peptidase, cysteine active site,Peptidase C1A, papain C-terminal,Cysteine peptidase n=1 Tax=Cinara cedri TaxID=506608 RepID=A0A5E4MYP9_9HEMI|nr:Cysteine peptidase, cysteine active site,Peptidase C1A, papain C-terminal,Cysteine peptidase [Cinara cedri]